MTCLAHQYNLEWEVLQAMEHGCTPDEALQEWDIYPYKENDTSIEQALFDAVCQLSRSDTFILDDLSCEVVHVQINMK